MKKQKQDILKIGKQNVISRTAEVIGRNTETLYTPSNNSPVYARLKALRDEYNLLSAPLFATAHKEWRIGDIALASVYGLETQNIRTVPTLEHIFVNLAEDLMQASTVAIWSELQTGAKYTELIAQKGEVIAKLNAVIDGILTQDDSKTTAHDMKRLQRAMKKYGFWNTATTEEIHAVAIWTVARLAVQRAVKPVERTVLKAINSDGSKAFPGATIVPHMGESADISHLIKNHIINSVIASMDISDITTDIAISVAKRLVGGCTVRQLVAEGYKERLVRTVSAKLHDTSAIGIY